MIKIFLMVFLGGGLGSALRFAVSLLFRYREHHFPWATFSVNMVGCFIMGLLLAFLSAKNRIGGDLEALLLIGFCGGFTTFSAFSAEGLQMLKLGYWQWYAVYVLLSVIFGLLLVFFGWKWGKM